MKYLKTYEKQNNKEIRSELNLKKYIIWNGSKIALLKIKNIHPTEHDIINVEELYYLENGELNITKPNSPFNRITGLIISEIENSKRTGRFLYQSDNYNDCLERLKMIVTTQKYNL